MVKVLAERHNYLKKVDCRKCGSTLEYTFDETEVKSYTDMGGYNDSYRVIKCPVCSEEVEVPFSNR